MPITMKDLLECGVHFGHQTRRWNPKMKKFIFGARKNIYIIDLQKTLRYFKYTYNIVRDAAAEGQTILFVGTKKKARQAIEEHAKRCGMPYVSTRWLGGMLTNYPAIIKSIHKLEIIEQMEEKGQLDLLAKKEALMLLKKKEKLNSYLEGLRHMKKMPEMMLVIDVVKEHIAVKEARRLGIKVIAPLNTDCDPDLIDYPIPGNDNTIHSINLFCREIANAIIEGKAIYNESNVMSDSHKNQEATEKNIDTKYADNQKDSNDSPVIKRADAEHIHGTAKSGSGNVYDYTKNEPSDCIQKDSEYKYVEQTVFFATNRQPSDKNIFGITRSETTYYGFCTITIPHDHRIGAIEKPFLKIFETPKKHFTISSYEKYTDKDLFINNINKFLESKDKTALIFIHGYNVSFIDAAYRTAQLSYDLEFDGLSMFYSWPSTSKIHGYLTDENNVEWAIPFFEKIINEIQDNTSIENICFIAHSMGNRLLSNVLKKMAENNKASKIEHVILTAPDIDTSVFKNNILPYFKKFQSKITLYASSNDKALKASKKIHGYPRLGDSKNICVCDNIDTIDVSNVDTSLMGHSYYGDNKSIISDLYYLIKHNLEPNDRHTLKPIPINHNIYWKFCT